MATVTLSYNAKNALALSILTSISQSGVFTIEEKSPYDAGFVDKIQKARKSTGKMVKTSDLWK